MSLNAKIKPISFLLGLVFAFSFVLPVFASPQGIGLELPTIEQQYPPDWNFVRPNTFVLYQSDFSTSDCNYTTYWNVRTEVYDSGDNNLGITTSGEHIYSTDFVGGEYKNTPTGYYLLLGSISSYPSTGDYYISFFPAISGQATPCGTAYYYVPYHVDKGTNTISPISLSTNGTCGQDNGTEITTAPPTGSNVLCLTGSAGEVIYDGIDKIWYWACNGSGGGTSDNCFASLSTTIPINGVCGIADGTTTSTAPPIEELCQLSATPLFGTYIETLNGWSWSCSGFNGGNNIDCSATNSGYSPPETPPTSVIPTPTDCDTFSGIDKILCNLGNIIQGLFLPSADKLVELQTTINNVSKVFPFNYLNVIAGVFSTQTITENSLTLTIMGNTETINPSYFDIPLIAGIKNGFTILVILAFIFWAIGYIKHFFK